MRSAIGVFAIVIVGLASLALTQSPDKKKADMVARGKYLVSVGDCNGCHTPPKYTPQGPVSDSSRFLSG
ncbi:MAG: diheme cytochrome c-553, partial [Bacteroidota bacterium]